jgi:hypothetical protein
MNNMNKTSKIISGIVILLVVAGGAFYGGMLYATNQAAATATAARAGFAGRGTRTGAAGAGFTAGTILSNDGTSITLQLPASTGGSKIILYSSATQIAKTTSGTTKDLTPGTSVNITGTANTDGSITAQSIQIRPAGQAQPGAPVPAQ